MRITNTIGNNTKTWYFNLTTNKLIFLLPLLCFSRSTFRCLLWVERIYSILLWDPESHQECIWWHGELVLFCLLNDKLSLCHEQSLQKAFSTPSQRVGQLDMICAHLPDSSLFSLFSSSSVGLQAASHKETCTALIFKSSGLVCSGLMELARSAHTAREQIWGNAAG